MKPLPTAAALGAAALLLGACAGRPDMARPVFSLGGAETPVALSLSMERGKTYFRTGQYGLALRAFRDALAEEPGSVRALNAIAATFDQLGRFDLADRYYGRALELEPHSVEVLNNLGYSHLLRGDLAKAQKYLAQARLIDDGQPVVQANLQLAAQGRMGTELIADARGAEATRRALPEPAAVARRQPQSEPQVQLVRIARGVQSLVTAPPVAYASNAVAREEAAAPRPQIASSAPQSGGEPATYGAVTPVAYRPATSAIEDPSWKIEVSNGTGREAMAARMRSYLAAGGVRADRLTNDDSFQNAESRIFYRPHAEAAAVALRAMLPVAVALVARDDQRADVRLLLGADLLAFDAGLMEQLALRTDE